MNENEEADGLRMLTNWKRVKAQKKKQRITDEVDDDDVDVEKRCVSLKSGRDSNDVRMKEENDEAGE